MAALRFNPLRASFSKTAPMVKALQINRVAAGAFIGSQISQSSRSYAKMAVKADNWTYWGELDTSPITADLLDFYSKNWPDRMRYHTSDYLAVLESLSAVSAKAQSDWPLLLDKSLRPPKELLNDLGCAVRELLARYRLPINPKISWALFCGASSMGCEASTISAIASTSVRSPEGVQIDVFDKPLYKPVMARFRKIVAQNENPYALVLESGFMMKERKYNAAIRILERALSKAEPGFIWAAKAHDNLGDLYVLEGKHDLAKEHFQKAADEGFAESWMALGRLGESAEEAADAYYKAGYAGIPEGFEALAHDYNIGSLQSVMGAEVKDQDDLVKLRNEYLMLARGVNPQNPRSST